MNTDKHEGTSTRRHARAGGHPARGAAAFIKMLRMDQTPAFAGVAIYEWVNG